MKSVSENIINEKRFNDVLNIWRGKIDCVISGAGISMPSGCPSGDQLKVVLWDMICMAYEDTVPFKPSIEKALPKIVSDYFRMEQLVDRLYLGDEKNKTKFNYAFHGAYKLLLYGYKPNCNHWYITHTNSVKHILTLNMDLLLEETISEKHSKEVVHLHGTADNRESISTTPTEYFEGLPQEQKAKFREAVEGKTVLVVGYSGRDIDVMPLFVDYPPEKIIWLQYAPDNATKELAPEVKNLIFQLRPKVEVIYGETELFLHALSNSEFPEKNFPSSSVPSGKSLEELAEQLAVDVDFEHRNIAVAMVLYELREFKAMRNVLETKCENPDMEYQRRKLLSRLEKNEGHCDIARRHLRALPFSPTWLKNAIEIIDTYRRQNSVAKTSVISYITYYYIKLIRCFFQRYRDKLNLPYAKLTLQLARLASLAGNMKKSKKYLNYLCQMFFECSMDEYCREKLDWRPACKIYGAYTLSLFHERASMVYLAMCEYDQASFCAERYLDISQYSQPSIQALAWRSVLTVLMEKAIMALSPLHKDFDKQFKEYQKVKLDQYLSEQNRIWHVILEAGNAMLTGRFSCDEIIKTFETASNTNEAYSDLIHSTMLVCWYAMNEKKGDVSSEVAHLLPKNIIKRHFCFKNYIHWLRMIRTAFSLRYTGGYKYKKKTLQRAEHFFQRTKCLSLAHNAAFLLNKIAYRERLTESELLRIILILP